MIHPNSTAVYHAQIKGKKEVGQNEKVVAYLLNQKPLSIRMLHKVMRDDGYSIELVSLRRAVHTLHKRGMLEITKDAPCEITGVTVSYYQLKPIQTKLFK